MSETETKPLALITGASGFIGSHLTENLKGRGWKIRALVRKTSDLRWLKGLDIQLSYGDFFDPGSLTDAVKGTDFIFHIAAAKSGNRQKIFQNNVDATVKLAEAAVKNAPALKRFVFFSSQAAAGPAECSNAQKCETDRCRPISDYGQSKLEAELRLKEFSARLPITIIRPPTVYGPRDKDVFLYFKWIERGLALLPGFRKRYIQMIFIDDLIEGTVRAALSERTVGNTYFLADPTGRSWQEISEAIALILGKNPVRLHLPLGLARLSAVMTEAGAKMTGTDSIFNRQKVSEMAQRFWTCSSRKAEDDFGFKCRYDLDSGIKLTADWYRINGWLKQSLLK